MSISLRKPARRATNPKPVRERLREGGLVRADYWGWTNTYTYTKSMGEQLIAQTPAWHMRSFGRLLSSRLCVFRFGDGTKDSRHPRRSF
jgi:hypothetical protein